MLPAKQPRKLSRWAKTFLLAQEYAFSHGAKHKVYGAYAWKPRKDRVTWEIRLVKTGPQVVVYNSKTGERIDLGPTPQAD